MKLLKISENINKILKMNNLTNTKQLSLCKREKGGCGYMTYIIMDENEKRYCGKCGVKR